MKPWSQAGILLAGGLLFFGNGVILAHYVFFSIMIGSENDIIYLEYSVSMLHICKSMMLRKAWDANYKSCLIFIKTTRQYRSWWIGGNKTCSNVSIISTFFRNCICGERRDKVFSLELVYRVRCQLNTWHWLLTPANADTGRQWWWSNWVPLQCGRPQLSSSGAWPSSSGWEHAMTTLFLNKYIFFHFSFNQTFLTFSTDSDSGPCLVFCDVLPKQSLGHSSKVILPLLIGTWSNNSPSCELTL